MADLAVQAQALDRQARSHKRWVAYHKQKVRECRAQQAEIEAKCRDLGIEVVHVGEGGTPWPKAPHRSST